MNAHVFARRFTPAFFVTLLAAALALIAILSLFSTQSAAAQTSANPAAIAVSNWETKVVTLTILNLSEAFYGEIDSIDNIRCWVKDVGIVTTTVIDTNAISCNLSQYGEDAVFTWTNTEMTAWAALDRLQYGSWVEYCFGDECGAGAVQWAKPVKIYLPMICNNCKHSEAPSPEDQYFTARNNSPTIIGKVTTLSVTTNITDMVDILWLPGAKDGQFVCDETITVTYPAIGVYTATAVGIRKGEVNLCELGFPQSLVLMNIAENLVATTTVTITDLPSLPEIQVSSSNTGWSPLGWTANLTATQVSGAEVLTYTWSLGDQLSFGPTITFTNTAQSWPGWYTATLTIEDEYSRIFALSHSFKIISQYPAYTWAEDRVIYLKVFDLPNAFRPAITDTNSVNLFVLGYGFVDPIEPGTLAWDLSSFAPGVLWTWATTDYAVWAAIDLYAYDENTGFAQEEQISGAGDGTVFFREDYPDVP